MTIYRFRTKPVRVTAVQWTGSNVHEVVAFMEQEFPVRCHNSHLLIATSSGNMPVWHGDWIVRDEKGEFSPCKPDELEERYSCIHCGGAGGSHADYCCANM